MRLYLSGPITGHKNFKRTFNKAQKILESEGYEVINPAQLDLVVGNSFTYDEIMQFDLDLLAKCDALVQFPTWRESKGACIEYGYAVAMDMIILELDTLLEAIYGKEEV